MFRRLRFLFLLWVLLSAFISSSFVQAGDYPPESEPEVPLASINEMRYPDARWSQSLLDILAEGPEVLPADFDAGLKAPPSNGSAETAHELSLLRKMQAERTAGQREAIRQEAYSSTYSIFVRNGIAPENRGLPAIRQFMDAVMLDVDYFMLREKMRFKRPRPSQLADDLEPVVGIPYHASYPSGHAAQALAIGIMLGMLDPERKDVYESLAVDVGHRREIAGIHYPSDSEAGRKLARVVVKALMDDPDIQDLYKKAKDEYNNKVLKKGK